MRKLIVRSERSHASLMREMKRGFAEIHEAFADQRLALVAILDRLPPPAPLRGRRLRGDFRQGVDRLAWRSS